MASIAVLILMLLFFVLSEVLLTNWEISPYHTALFPGAAIFAGLSLWYETRIKRTGHISPPVVTGLCVAFLLWALGSVTVIDVFPYPTFPASFFPVLIVALPLLFIIRYQLLYPIMLLSEVGYSLALIKGKDPSIHAHDLFTSIMAWAISLVLLSVVMQLRVQDGSARIRYRMLSETDMLTGILNKAASESSVRQYLQRHTSGTCALLMLDIDVFKQINDTFGHQVGDWLLEKMGKVLRHVFRSTDIIGRTGGDEFLLCIKEFQQEEVLRLKCSQIQELLRQGAMEVAPDIFAEKKEPHTCSIGAALCEEGGLSFEELFRIADDALYEAKFRGKGRCIIYTVGGLEETVPVKSQKPLVFVAGERQDEQKELQKCLEPDFSVLTAGWDSRMMSLLSRYQEQVALLVLSSAHSETSLEYRKLRQRLQNVPVVVVAHDTHEAERARRAGANDVWELPLSKEHVINSARTCMRTPMR